MYRDLAKRLWDWRIRISYWAHIAITVRGVSERDRRVLDRAIARSPFTSARDLHRWKDPVIDADATVSVRGVGLFKVRGKTDDLWHVTPGREPAVLRYIQRALKPGDTFVDSGANIGFYSVVASKAVGSTGRVIAVEMMPSTATLLREHLAMNECSNSTVAEVALSSQAGRKVRAFIPDGQWGQATIGAQAQGRKGTNITVETTTLDLLLADFQKVRLMKMDLEGVEADVLRGASAALQRIDAIIFEHRRGDNDTARLLEMAGFAVRVLDRANGVAERRR